ncbi:hypothetical protein CLOSTASPAR_02943 [[Clostridium] asparagiforme DSM 15981]|uniref:Uncharacterized protein n=1 Tax=[Clostridium] asparagiforme DSM 15981 TaxID=518636 RepID=C0D105_9FIRM|nr:hypothetical protein CLOSTASPAR_02943 [[Clostridium] asparagiforme DSM 15981]
MVFLLYKAPDQIGVGGFLRLFGLFKYNIGLYFFQEHHETCLTFF